MSRHDHDQFAHPGHPGHLGLQADLARLAAQSRRRQLLHWLGGGAASLALTALGSRDAAAAGGQAASGRCARFPDETAGPFPGNGSNRSGGEVANALALSGIVRSDIRGSIAGASGVADGVPLTIKLRLQDAKSGCTPLPGYAVYLWHCDREGRYSMYSRGVTAENYLRGVQAAGADGTATFVTSFPGCYAGRMPHMHFEVYRDLGSATLAANRLKTTQLAFDPAECRAVYAASGYGASLANLARTSFADDGVFSDGVSLQLARISGDKQAGFVAALDVAISA